MASIDVSLRIAKFENVTKFKIVKGEPFTIHLNGYDAPSVWFSNNDQVLDIKHSGTEAEVMALEIGLCRVLILTENDDKIIEVNIEVVEAIIPLAVSLGLKVSSPTLK